MKLATLCYLESKGKTLMIHRNKKEHDTQGGMWNWLGGKLEQGEDPERCVIREFREESGLTIVNPKLKGMITFPGGGGQEDWYIFIFLAKKFRGVLTESDEGELQWVDEKLWPGLNIFAGDKIFMQYIHKKGFFSGRFEYKDKKLIRHEIKLYR